MKIVTPRLILRDFRAEDLPAYLAGWEDPRHAEFYGPEEVGPDFARSLFNRFLDWAAERPRRNYQLAIVQKDRLIGSCGVRMEGCEPGIAEFGLELAPESWGRGLASEAARAMLRFGFRDLGVREVRGETVTENVRVQRLVERLGFTRVGVKAGPDWMQDRGWTQTEWRLTTEELRDADA